MSGPHCLIFERDVTGHRLHHVRHLTEVLVEIGCEVTLASRKMHATQRNTASI